MAEGSAYYEIGPCPGSRSWSETSRPPPVRLPGVRINRPTRNGAASRQRMRAWAGWGDVPILTQRYMSGTVFPGCSTGQRGHSRTTPRFRLGNVERPLCPALWSGPVGPLWGLRRACWRIPSRTVVGDHQGLRTANRPDDPMNGRVGTASGAAPAALRRAARSPRGFLDPWRVALEVVGERPEQVAAAHLVAVQALRRRPQRPQHADVVRRRLGHHVLAGP